MKKLVLLGSMLLAVATTTLVGTLLQPDTASAAPRCDAKNVGAPRGKAYQVSGNTATVKFKVTGPENCRVKLTSNSFYAPTLNGKPWSKQILYERVTKVYKPGTYTMSVGLPPKGDKKKGCFYQVDLTYGVENKLPLVGYGHGRIPCGEKPKKIKVCDVNTRATITILEKNYNSNIHAPVGSERCKEPEEPPVPNMIEVCLIKEKTRVNIREDQYDSSIHTQDFSICDEEPEVPEPPKPEEPKEEIPEEMPETGPLQAVAQMVGAGSLVASAGYYIQSRRQ